MNVEEIKAAVDEGKTVCWGHEGYEAQKFESKSLDPDTLQSIPYKKYEIVCLSNNHMIGLTWADETTLNGKEEDFFVKGE
jgi:hypothetical protein